MKTMTQTRMTVRVLVGLLTAICLLTVFNSCAEKDDSSSYNPIKDKLVGAWYAEAERTGTVRDVKIPFTKRMQVYKFENDGTGKWYKIYSTAGYDVLHSMSIPFHYTVTDDGTVNVALDEVGRTPSGWKMLLQDGTLLLEEETPEAPLVAFGSNGNPIQAVTLSPATSSQMAFAEGGTGDDPQFISDWENCLTVSVNGMANPVATPWNSESQSTIPYSISKQVTRSQGWEMAFCSLNNSATPDVRYFGLYNKWSGTLRVFHYIVNPTGYGNEIDYQVWMGRDEMAKNEAPFYNSLEYGIPASHVPDSTLRKDVNLFGDSHQTQPFMTWVTPYRIYEQALISGWYCFDIDMSGFVPDGNQWRDVQDDIKLMIVPQFRNDQNITLRGALIGDISGTQAPERMVKTGGGNMFSGICGVLDMIGGTSTSALSSCNAYTSVMKNDASAIGQALNPVKYWGGLSCNVASVALNLIGDVLAEPETYDTIPGRIDMKLNAQIDLTGTISNFVSSDQPIYRVTLANIDNANGQDGHFGRGVWSLAEDPVVYVDTLDIMGEKESNWFNKFYWAPNCYSNLDTQEDCKLRLVWFLDPTTVKVNINRDLFPDVANVTVTALCGTYTDRSYGYTDIYRKFLTLEDRPTYLLSHNDELAITTQTTTPRMIKVSAEDLLNYEGADDYETTSNATTVVLPDFNQYVITGEDDHGNPSDSVKADLRNYGRVISEFDKQMVVMPQIYVPAESFVVQDPLVPDLVVSVDVTFEACGSTFHFTKCFIPKIKLINRDETLKRYKDMQTFVDNSRSQKPTGTLANDPTIPVYSPDAYLLWGKTMNMLKLVGK